MAITQHLMMNRLAMNAGIKPTASEVELGGWSRLPERNCLSKFICFISINQNYYRKQLRISVTKETGLPSLHTLRDSVTPLQLHWLCHG